MWKIRPQTKSLRTNPHQMHPKPLPQRAFHRVTCAFCGTPFTKTNDSREHLIPNAIGGRRALRHFLCKDCNNRSGRDWDSVLSDQLKPLCTLLNIDRQRRSVRALRVKTLGGDTFQLHADGSAALPHTTVKRTHTANQVAIAVSAPSVPELEKTLRGLARTYPQIDVEEAIQDATVTRKYQSDPWYIPLHFGGLEAGRSVIKSLTALAAYVGIDIEDLEHAKEYLLSSGKPCFGFCNDTDVVRNRPDDIFFHCVAIAGDPQTGQILGYVEYFGYQRIVGCLSSTYSGPPFKWCYAIDPIRGEELDLEIELAFSPEDVQAIYDYQRLDLSIQRAAVGRLLAHWSKSDLERALSDAIEDAFEYACAKGGVKGSERVSDDQARVAAELFGERIRPALEHFVGGRRFTPDQLRQVLQRIQDDERDRKAGD